MGKELSYVFSGCSFTDMHLSWARQLAKDVIRDNRRTKIAAKSGAGNDFIANSAVNAALQAEKDGFKPDISIMWSSPARFEFPMHPTMPFSTELFNFNKKQNNDFNPGIPDTLPNGIADKKLIENFWLLQAGKVTKKNEWSCVRAIDKEYQKAFRYFQEFIWNYNYHWYSTLRSILNVQNFCEAKNWPYRFTIFRSCLEEYKKHCAPQFKLLQDEVKWDKFIFTDDNDGGLREYNMRTVNTWDDGYDNHPSYEAHEKFLYDFWLPKFPEVYK